MSTQKIRSLAWALLLVGCADGVGDLESGEEEDVQGASAALYSENLDNIWPSAHSIRVCFQATEEVWDEHRAHFDAFKARVPAWIEGAFEGIPRVDINFTGFQNCPNFDDFEERDEGTDTIEIYVKSTGGGAQASGRNVIYAGTASPRAWVVHEMMHALGYAHEHRRRDAPGSVGTWSEYTDDRMVCDAEDIMWDLTDAGVPVQPTCDPSNTRQDAEGTYLTRYDFWSITNATNYCHCRDELSELDRLGLEITYPTPESLTGSPIHVFNGFRLGDSAAVGFENMELHHDWFVRGALPPAFDEGAAYWRVGPLGTALADRGEGLTVPRSDEYRATWRDFRGRAHSTETLEVEVSSPKAAAIVLAIL